MTPTLKNHPWSSDTLFSKALIYVGKMEKTRLDDADYGLWSSLSLEFLARAALSHISPTLLADSHSWRNIHFSLGHEVTMKGFSPKSIGIKDVFNRLNEITPGFNNEILGYCSQHIERRNAELHTGEMVFSGLKNSIWLSRYYKSCESLLEIMEKKVEDLFEMPNVVNNSIRSLSDQAGKSVQHDISAYKKVWSDKSDDEKDQCRNQASLWATRQSGHRINCPVCESTALLQGSPSSSIETITDQEQDKVIQKQDMLPVSFECVSCGLKMNGYSRLYACGLGDSYVNTTIFTIAEFYNLYTEDEIYEARREGEASAISHYEDDNNE
ncbi:hypothetical protein [Pantoea endophytica]|uniref:hypothetical protein n=1 Tax=Pantoea endophytica TaxID=92488 RepID=UPI001FD830E2|nr:hypothetical protein [Pantoea endophytica]